MKPATPLTDLRIRKAKPDSKPYRLHDGDGLALLVQPTGMKSWQLRYRHEGKEQTATLGKLDALSLAAARAKADELRELADKGEHLTAIKRTEKAVKKVQTMADKANTFAAISAGWMLREGRRKKWTPAYRAEVAASVARHLSDLSPLRVSTIKAAQAFPVVDKVEREAPMMAEKVARRLYAIMDHAVLVGAIDVNPLPRRKASKIERRHYPAITNVAKLGEVLRAARAADPCKGIQRAHSLLAFTALRVSEVVGAKWSEFELDGVEIPVGDSHRMKLDRAAGNWNVPRERMKRKDAVRGPHVVPLPPALLAMLLEWKKADSGSSEYVCPAPRDPAKHITPEACEKHYRDALHLQHKHSPHSWRSAFSTICREASKDGDAIESQLDHVVGNKVASAYDRAKRLEIRRELLTWYESTLIAARDGARVVALGRRAGV